MKKVFKGWVHKNWRPMDLMFKEGGFICFYDKIFVSQKGAMEFWEVGEEDVKKCKITMEVGK